MRLMRKRALSSAQITREQKRIKSSIGYELQVEILRPQSPKESPPNLLMVPDFGHDSSMFLSKSTPLHAEELAAQGWNVILFDPAGRGESWGNEDWGGEEHQEEVAQLLRTAEGAVGVYSVGGGLPMALGGIQRASREIKFLVDYEGVADPELLLRLPLHPDSSPQALFWEQRNGLPFLRDLPCRYHRFQAEIDHTLPDDLRHARRVLRELAASNNQNFRLNHHRLGEFPDRPRWIAPGPLAARRTLLEALDLYRKQLNRSQP